MKTLRFTLPLLTIGCLLFTGCSIARRVSSVPPGTRIDVLYVQQNHNVHMEGLHPELVAQLQGLGYTVKSFDGPRPKDARFMLSYTANWRWDMAMYLTYFHADLLDGGRILGSAEYDANFGGARPDKFGRTAEKIRPLLIELLQNAEPASSAATATALGDGKSD